MKLTRKQIKSIQYQLVNEIRGCYACNWENELKEGLAEVPSMGEVTSEEIEQDNNLPIGSLDFYRTQFFAKLIGKLKDEKFLKKVLGECL